MIRPKQLIEHRCSRKSRSALSLVVDVGQDIHEAVEVRMGLGERLSKFSDRRFARKPPGLHVLNGSQQRGLEFLLLFVHGIQGSDNCGRISSRVNS